MQCVHQLDLVFGHCKSLVYCFYMESQHPEVPSVYWSHKCYSFFTIAVAELQCSVKRLWGWCGKFVFE
jgi:hypothetical protein